MNRTNLFDKIIATGFGSGYCPIAPGTAGTLVAALIWTMLWYFLSPDALLWTTAILIALFTLLGVRTAGVMESLWGKDPARVVVDEMVGVWIPLLAAGDGQWYHLAVAVVAFRLFDIFKPLGIRRLERIGGGWGIMLDDIAAGLYSLIIVGVLRWITG
ncbi:MAG: phosphatidylglycerophosphatase A [Tannerella sp.]|jgi:phosphatidylglycerophosphatase A|nr:phosphatidylglycerophosphatase A [Tannerella sp.]